MQAHVYNYNDCECILCTHACLGPHLHDYILFDQIYTYIYLYIHDEGYRQVFVLDAMDYHVGTEKQSFANKQPVSCLFTSNHLPAVTAGIVWTFPAL